MSRSSGPWGEPVFRMIGRVVRAEEKPENYYSIVNRYRRTAGDRSPSPTGSVFLLSTAQWEGWGGLSKAGTWRMSTAQDCYQRSDGVQRAGWGLRGESAGSHEGSARWAPSTGMVVGCPEPRWTAGYRKLGDAHDAPRCTTAAGGWAARIQVIIVRLRRCEFRSRPRAPTVWWGPLVLSWWSSWWSWSV